MTKAEQRKLAKELKAKLAKSNELFDEHVANPASGPSLSFIIGFLQGAIESATFELEHF
jgi:hypothetical protein